MAAARDDSVIRGSLIATLILLVLSLALNFFLYRWGDGQATSEKSKSDQLNNANGSIRNLEAKLTTLKKILGQGELTDDEFTALKESTTDDAEIDAIASAFIKDVGQMGRNIPAANRNYPAIPQFMVNSLRDRNVQYKQAREEATRIEVQAKSDVSIAEQAAADAAADKKKMEATLNERIVEFDTARNSMKQKSAEIADNLTNLDRQFNDYRSKTNQELASQKSEKDSLLTVVEQQKRRINEMQQLEFEVAQGEVTYVSNNLVQINLGSADSLRNAVVFSVVDSDATRITDAEPKAKIEVIAIRRDHLALCRVIDAAPNSDPIIPGDKIYSPFWAPGRTVKIALAGNIDFDDDRRSDNEVLRGMILAAGGEVVEELDPSVRFLVVGSTPEAGTDDDAEVRAEAGKLGEVRAQAKELGITVIPVWKLMNYIQVISDARTTPFGSAVRGKDFPPEAPENTGRRLPNDVSKLYKEEK
ncbi:hypothetical protein FF011L_17350 [Roseimaritima multifibrata]|uniref:Uncharacterized protein n=1 Tax=Roseimaritima multifibrata TaxID=1930274 RepID=A0A517MDL5_9BACT|nr:hypothetical protein [Roseimaritima multifibrata]QDS92980.1 hypothetical protein FF011L_17350 [Roseimaritima multifibrata]